MFFTTFCLLPPSSKRKKTWSKLTKHPLLSVMDDKARISNGRSSDSSPGIRRLPNNSAVASCLIP